MATSSPPKIEPSSTAPFAAAPRGVARSNTPGLPTFSAPSFDIVSASLQGEKKSFTLWKKNHHQQILVVAKQLSLLVETGVDIAEAISVVVQQLPDGAVRDCWETIHDDISSGVRLPTALGKHREVLGPEFIASVASGEASGRLADVLRSLAAKLERDLQMRSILRNALSYPAILCVVAFGVLNSLIWFVLPQFEGVFRDMNFNPPALTQFLLDSSKFIRTYYPILAAVTIASVIGSIVGWRTPQFAIVRDKALCNAPLIGRAYRNLMTGCVFSMCGNMLHHGVSLIEALQLASRATSSQSLKTLLAELEEEVMQGNSLSKHMAESDFLPEGAAAMVTMAERTGQLDRVLCTTGEFYEREGTNQLQQTFKLLEPIMIVFMGGLVALVVASVMLPMMDANSAVR